MNSLMDSTTSSGCPPGETRWASSGGTPARGHAGWRGGGGQVGPRSACARVGAWSSWGWKGGARGGRPARSRQRPDSTALGGPGRAGGREAARSDGRAGVRGQYRESLNLVSGEGAGSPRLVWTWRTVARACRPATNMRPEPDRGEKRYQCGLPLPVMPDMPVTPQVSFQPFQSRTKSRRRVMAGTLPNCCCITRCVCRAGRRRHAPTQHPDPHMTPNPTAGA